MLPRAADPRSAAAPGRSAPGEAHPEAVLDRQQTYQKLDEIASFLHRKEKSGCHQTQSRQAAEIPSATQIWWLAPFCSYRRLPRPGIPTLGFVHAKVGLTDPHHLRIREIVDIGPNVRHDPGGYIMVMLLQI